MRPRDWKAEKFRGKHQLPCHYCGKLLTRSQATVDHVKPKSKGGNNKPRNFRIACPTCNKEKGNKWDEVPKTPKNAGLYELGMYAPDPWWPQKKIKLGSAMRSSGSNSIQKRETGK